MPALAGAAEPDQVRREPAGALEQLAPVIRTGRNAVQVQRRRIGGGSAAVEDGRLVESDRVLIDAHAAARITSRPCPTAPCVSVTRSSISSASAPFARSARPTPSRPTSAAWSRTSPWSPRGGGARGPRSAASGTTRGAGGCARASTDDGVDLSSFVLLAGRQTPVAFVAVDAGGEPTYTVYGADLGSVTHLRRHRRRAGGPAVGGAVHHLQHARRCGRARGHDARAGARAVARAAGDLRPEPAPAPMVVGVGGGGERQRLPAAARCSCAATARRR